MVKRKKEGASASTKIFSGIFFLAGLAVLVYIGVSLGKEAYRKRQVQKEIENLQSEIAKVSQENSEMSNLMSYLSSQEFQEKEAREKLNLQKENEKMIVLHKDLEQPAASTDQDSEQNRAASEDKSPNWQKWLKFFFGNKN
ncbi:MAG: hypothetical protein A3J76_00245 [Candidatus Moranbacteria bacterium RBG_13_45_13]|nr:MAG: hypothetical protein A3J76_00245 [Candidatus Moranbacteria bacterium RBG_13_45_13]